MNTTYLETRHNCTIAAAYKRSFIPMIWGRKTLLYMNISKDAQYVMGFNEPNHFEQSNITAKQAAFFWREIEEKSHGRPLVSPAASRCKTAECHGDATEWFDEFFANCQGCRVDYLATHMYKCHPETVMDYLKDLYQRYRLKIWLTEFACPFSTDPEEELKYMKQLIPRLEAADYVFRFVSRWHIFVKIHTGELKLTTTSKDQ